MKMPIRLVVQLRQDNVAATMYNIVGFQTHLAWPEQRRVFSLIPGLENLKITRYGLCIAIASFLQSRSIRRNLSV